jgi:hypothetical protein
MWQTSWVQKGVARTACGNHSQHHLLQQSLLLLLLLLSCTYQPFPPNTFQGFAW